MNDPQSSSVGSMERTEKMVLWLKRHKLFPILKDDIVIGPRVHRRPWDGHFQQYNCSKLGTVGDEHD